jgi:hypothetical protein
MPGSTIVKGHARQTLVAETNLSVTGSTALGTFETNKFSRFAGLFSVIGSITVAYAMGVNSGSYQVSSSFTVNSGAACFDVLNYGRYCDFAITGANSQVLAALIFAEPLR